MENEKTPTASKTKKTTTRRRITMRASATTAAAKKLIRLAEQHGDNRASTLEDIIRPRRVPVQDEALVRTFRDLAADFLAVLNEKRTYFAAGNIPAREDVKEVLRALEAFCRQAEALRWLAQEAAGCPKKRRKLPPKCCRRGKRPTLRRDRVEVALPRDTPIGRKVEDFARALQISAPACLRLLLIHNTGIFIAPQERVLEMFAVYEKCWSCLRHILAKCAEAGCIQREDQISVREMKDTVCSVAADIKAGRLLKCG